jgi:hypothetical protein
MVTAELAVALPSLLLVTAFGLSLAGELALSVRCVDAAEVAARLAARGEPAAVVLGAAHELAPGASVAVRRGTAAVTVTVATGLHAPGLGARLPLPAVRESVTMPLEPGSDG